MADLSFKSLTQISTSLVKIARPVHWVKNLAIFAALVFTGDLFDKALFYKVVWAFMSFNLATSATYIFNDIMDVNSDSLHPVKKFRPIASGMLSKKIAWMELIFLAYLSLVIANYISPTFFLLLFSYLLMQLAYSIFLKNLPIIDILIIATGFILRVYAGAFVIDAHLSVWFLLCVISASLFLASGKRRAELGLIESPGLTRKSLAKYPRELLNSFVTMFGNATWMSWALFSFFESPRASIPVWLFLAELSRATTINKLLMVTIPITIFGVMRYLSLIFEGRSEAPEKLLLTDLPLVASVVLWVSVVVWVFYGGVSIQGI